MNEFTTENGTKLFWKVKYSLGGMNYFTGGVEPRGYSVHIKRNRNEFKAFTGLDQEGGASRAFIHEVKRRSNKQEQVAMEMVTEEYLQGIADRFGI